MLLLLLWAQLNAIGIAKENIDCWHIDYTSNFAGPLKLEFSDQTISMRLEKLGLYVISTGPKWNLLVYNELNKKFMSVTNQQWQSSKFLENLLRRRKAAIGNIETDYTHQFKTIEGIRAAQVILRTKKATGLLEQTSEIWVAEELLVPSQFKQLLRIALGVSGEFNGTPLQISVIQRNAIDQKPNMVQALAAYRILKTTIGPLDFKALDGYKEVKSEVNLMVDDDRQ